MQGTIYKIERLAVHDGPGIRTVVFLKGCPLSCFWCSSPESQQMSFETGYFEESCTGCFQCLNHCTQKAISITEEGKVTTNQTLCLNCGECLSTCVYQARRSFGFQVSVEELVREIEKDEVFFHHSSGGVTLSGGEVLTQAEFARQVLQACVQRGYHTAIETCGFQEWELFAQLLPLIDLLYFDIKHMSAQAHQKYTGVPNDLILSNIQKADQASFDFSLIVRFPVITGFNDALENIQATAQFVRKLSKLKRVELLPYHPYGVHTYQILGENYGGHQIQKPTDERLQMIQDVFASYQIEVQIGG
jgi:pyruvate formate lyase activating enzyme